MRLFSRFLFERGGRGLINFETAFERVRAGGASAKPRACSRGVQPRSERPALPRRAARIRGGPSCDSKNESPTIEAISYDKCRSSSQLRTGYYILSTIACIYEREGSVKLAARRGTKRSSGAKSSSLFQRLNRLLSVSPQLQTSIDAPSSPSI